MKNVFMLVTSDEYELPLAVAGSIYELARMTGREYNTIRCGIYKYYHYGKNGPYRKVEIDEDEDDG